MLNCKGWGYIGGGSGGGVGENSDFSYFSGIRASLTLKLPKAFGLSRSASLLREPRGRCFGIAFGR